ncbi:hypothetical protein L1987_53569 [Smallanthus sonchifolius]|uniref:Uncharacterized protein n=1 Tax=Smallanthus sonchifolius TaxID=185202 RepID=A0ACB9EVQ4_9ASTR|nr:hypothetical protein L1987_53569 [Smallanthus sonchifolius]
MKKLQQEATEVAQGRSTISEDDLKNMPYLKAVMKESFRLHIPVPLLVPRKSLQDVKLMGYDIPAGTQVLVNAWAIARDPAVWDEPLEFRPERFLNSSVNYHGSHFELIPYGAGQRICSGMQFSVAIIELALANIAYKFDFALPNGMKYEDLDMSDAYGVTVHRKFPLLVTLLCQTAYDRFSLVVDLVTLNDELLEGVIEEHVNKLKDGGAKDDEVKDFVDIFLDVQKENTTGFTLHRDSLKAVLLDVFAGTESTFASLEWAMSELVRNPRIMKKLQQEATEVAQGRSTISEDDLKNMPYLKAVMKESFRLHIPVPLLVPRKSLQDVKLMGYDIPAGTQVLVNAWAIARDPAVWDEPLEFRPERFLNSSVNYHGSHFELIPYGAGQRICSGMQFSVAIIELALANIAYKFDFALPYGMKYEDLDMSGAYGVTVHRKFPLLVTVSSRF